MSRNIKDAIINHYLKQNSVSNYYFHTKDINGGKLVRSSTLLIRKEDGTLDGALCINLDTEPFTEMISFPQSFLPEHSAFLNFSKETEVPQLNEEENVSSTPENASGSAEVTKGVKEFKKYVVQSGDTGESIIKHYYGSWSQEKADLVMKANNLTNFDKINIGQELIIPIQE